MKFEGRSADYFYSDMKFDEKSAEYLYSAVKFDERSADCDFALPRTWTFL